MTANQFSVGQRVRVVSRHVPIPYATELPISDLCSDQIHPTVRLDYLGREVWLYRHEIEPIPGDRAK